MTTGRSALVSVMKMLTLTALSSWLFFYFLVILLPRISYLIFNTGDGRSHLRIEGAIMLSLGLGVAFGRDAIDQWNLYRANVKHPRIIHPPGLILCRFIGFFCSAKTLKCLVEPTISDFQFEYFEALSHNEKLRAKWIVVKGYLNLLKALGIWKFASAALDFWRKSP